MKKSQQQLANEDATFHIRLLKYYFRYANEEEQVNQEDEDILHFEFGDMTYSIKFIDLKLKADAETIILKNKRKPTVVKGKNFDYILNKKNDE